MAHSTRTGYDQVTLDLLAKAGLPLPPLNKSADRGDASWSRVLATYSAAAAGDPQAMHAWATFKALDPGGAKLIPELVEASRPRKIGKSKRKVSVGAARHAILDPADWDGERVTNHDPSFEAFVRASGATPEAQDAALKAIGSGGPRQLPQEYDVRDEFGHGGVRPSFGGVADEFTGFMDGLRRIGAVPATVPDPDYRIVRRA